jgi:hypothetical protein
MELSDSGGLAAVSVGSDHPLFWLITLALLVVVIGGLWKFGKLLWAAFSG